MGMGRTRHSMDILPPLSKRCGLASVGRACDPVLITCFMDHFCLEVRECLMSRCFSGSDEHQRVAGPQCPPVVCRRGWYWWYWLAARREDREQRRGCWRHWSLVLESGMHHIPVTGLMGVIMNMFVFSSSDVTQKSFSDIKREPRISTFSQMLSFLTPLGWTNCHSALSPQRSKFWWLFADFHSSPLIYL